MQKRASAKAKKAAQAGDLPTLKSQIEAGKSGAAAELLQLGAGHLEVLKYLLEAGADPDERVGSEGGSIDFPTFRALAEICADDGDDSLMDLLGGSEPAPTGDDPLIGRWACGLAKLTGDADEDDYATEAILGRLTGTTLVVFEEHYEDNAFGSDATEGEWIRDGAVVRLADGSILELGERKGTTVLTRHYVDEEHGWPIEMTYWKRE